MASFSQAFREARQRLGAGKTFTWNGKQYSTNLANESGSSRRSGGSSAPPARPNRSAPTSSPRPKARPDATSRLTRAAGAAIDRAERQAAGGRGSGERKASPVSGASRSVAGKVTPRANSTGRVTDINAPSIAERYRRWQERWKTRTPNSTSRREARTGRP